MDGLVDLVEKGATVVFTDELEMTDGTSRLRMGAEEALELSIFAGPIPLEDDGGGLPLVPTAREGGAVGLLTTVELLKPSAMGVGYGPKEAGRGPQFMSVRATRLDGGAGS